MDGRGGCVRWYWRRSRDEEEGGNEEGEERLIIDIRVLQHGIYIAL